MQKQHEDRTTRYSTSLRMPTVTRMDPQCLLCSWWLGKVSCQLRERREIRVSHCSSATAKQPLHSLAALLTTNDTTGERQLQGRTMH